MALQEFPQQETRHSHKQRPAAQGTAFHSRVEPKRLADDHERNRDERDYESFLGPPDPSLTPGRWPP